MLSFLSSIFDPLGLVGPVTLKGKTLLQEAVKQGRSWADIIAAPISEGWNSWVKGLEGLKKFQIYIVASSQPSSMKALWNCTT